jgi:hypothetical protein
MCELCDIQDNEGISPETMFRIVKVVEEHEKAHLDHTLLAVLNTLGVKEVTITAEAAQDAAEALELHGVSIQENISSDWSAMTYTVTVAKPKEQSPEAEPLRPLRQGEVSEGNDLVALFKALGLDF